MQDSSHPPANDNGAQQNGRPCPICGKPSFQAMRPFCSKRCADVDLNRWMTGTYAIPAEEQDDEGAAGER